MRRKNGKLKIGVYIPNYNYAEFLPWAMRSIQRQTRKPDIILFIDDASTDNSIDILKKEMERNSGFWVNKPNSEFIYSIVHEENMGAVATMNEAVKFLIEKGCDYVCGLSADDVFDGRYLELCQKELSKTPENVGYIYTWVKRIGDEFGVDKHEEFNSDNLMKYNFVHGSALIKSSAWQAVGGFDNLKVCEDWDMFKRMARLGIIGKLIPKPLLLWRKHSRGCRTLGTRGK